jgi:hypothetical protein
MCRRFNSAPDHSNLSPVKTSFYVTCRWVGSAAEFPKRKTVHTVLVLSWESRTMPLLTLSAPRYRRLKASGRSYDSGDLSAKHRPGGGHGYDWGSDDLRASRQESPLGGRRLFAAFVFVARCQSRRRVGSQPGVNHVRTHPPFRVLYCTQLLALTQLMCLPSWRRLRCRSGRCADVQ